jgi:hypothetical protein
VNFDIKANSACNKNKGIDKGRRKQAGAELRQAILDIDFDHEGVDMGDA